MTTDATNATPAIDTKAEKKRGYKEGSRNIELLRARWPKAFPAKSHEVRPLTSGALPAMIEAFGWNRTYARAVLSVWKVQPSYCRAILCYSTRINLDGSASGEEVDDMARASASSRLEESAAQRVKRAARQKENDMSRAVATESAEPPAPAALPDPEPETAAPVEAPKARKLLVAGSAAMEAALKRRLAGGAVTTEVLKTVPVSPTVRRREQGAR